MTFISSTLLVPIAVLGTLLAHSHQAPASASISFEKRAAKEAVMSASSMPTLVSSDQMNFVLQRKERIQRMLMTLDRVAAITQQMKPENADRIEPVIVDLAEQAIELANEKSLKSESTDVTLTKLETTVNELVHTMSRYVEPEASL